MSAELRSLVMRRSITRLSLVAVMLLAIAPHVFAQTPFVTTEAPKMTPTIDGDVSDWASNTDKLRMELAHSGGGDPLAVDIRYAWDDANFYILVEEVSDDDPTSDYSDVEWGRCGVCDGGDYAQHLNPAHNPVGVVRPWTTDSVGFYDRGLKYPDTSTRSFEIGPYTQYWVGLTTEDDLVYDVDFDPATPDVPQYRHSTKTPNSVFDEGGTLMNIGPRAMEPGFDLALFPDKEDALLTTPQSAFSAVGDSERVVEFFMAWEQIRYDESSSDPLVQDAIDFLKNFENITGHFLDDVKEGYEFRLDPLLVDGKNEGGTFPFGGQTFPDGSANPEDATVAGDIAVVRLVGVPSGGTDTEPDGDVDGADFLFLQRNDPTLLAQWQLDYGSVASVVGVPE
ncbi:MAG: hypothetical protein ACR2NU_09970, partial [Aeoliella sp.]